ncbi:MAG: molybdopterin biosynthesis protein [Clostridia bacterium]
MMKYEYLNNVPLAQAVSEYLKILRETGMSSRTETIPVADALERVTAKAVYARICAPHYNACAMDGIALEAAVTFGATETTPVTLAPTQFIRVDTGDPLPQNCNAVVMIEDCVEQGDAVVLYETATPWQHVRQIGEDVAAGDMILPSYSTIEPAVIGAMLAGGVQRVEVLAKPRVGIIPTGDEIVPPSDHPNTGEVMEFNSAIFSGMLTKWGAEPAVYPIVRDVFEQIAAALKRAVSECDLVLLCAGTSAGRDDDSTAVVERLGMVFCHGIAIKPGKPAVLGVVGAKPVMGVPGYPVSGIIVLEELVRPVIDTLLKRPRELPENVCVTMGRKLNSSLKYREFVRATLGLGSDGMLTAVPLNLGAGVVTSFVKADCLLDVPQSCEGYEAGERAHARLLKPISRIEQTVRVVGSHDPLIDEAADELHRQNPNLFVSSAHVGSIGGIMAVMRGEAQLGGIHLLDESDGSYNISYVERFIPGGGVALVECVQRVQGLMVQKGNPRHIGRIDDLQTSGISFVNRQKGSGTRILCDFLLKKQGIAAENVRGYAREELTHTAVAAQIAGGTADCGLGILSAARIYDLDFLPICNEQYDLLVALEGLNHPNVQTFLKVLQSEAFAGRLARLGGYVLDQPGRIRKLWIKR